MIPLVVNRSYGVLQPGDRQYQLPDHMIKAVDFVVLRDRWGRIEPTKNKKDISYLLRQADRCRGLGKPFIIGIMTGEVAPKWLAAPRASFGKHKNVPLPWEKEVLDRYENLMEYVATAFRSHPTWITGPTIPSQEMHLNGYDKARGYSPQKMESAWKRAIQIVSSRFDTCILSLSGQVPVQKYLDNVVNAAKALGKDRIIFQHNSLGVQTQPTATHVRKLKALHDQGFSTMNEMVQPGNTGGIPRYPWVDGIILYPEDVARIPQLPR